METLVQQGKILYVGSSNFAGWHIAKANEIAKSRHFLGLVSEQALYNLKDRMIEMEVIPACRDYGMGLIPWSPLGGGLLGGTRGKEKMGRRAEKDRVPEVLAHHPRWACISPQISVVLRVRDLGNADDAAYRLAGIE